MKILVLLALISTVFYAKETPNEYKLLVTEKGFEPATLKVAPNQEISLAFTRKTDSTCATEIIFPAQKIKKELPLNKAVTINLGILKKGEVSFSCGMNMVNGVINVQ